MGTATKKRNALYHSGLQKMGRTTLRFKGDVKDGNYGPYVFVQIKGESDDRLYNIDSDHVREEVERTLRTAKDGWVEVEAEGAKQGATLRVLKPGTEGPTFPGDAPHSNEWGGNGDSGSPSGNVAVDVAVGMTLRAVQGLEAGGVRVDSDAAARIYNTHYIQASRG